MTYTVEYTRKARGHRVTVPGCPVVFFTDRATADAGDDEAQAIRLARSWAAGKMIAAYGMPVPDVDDWQTIVCGASVSP